MASSAPILDYDPLPIGSRLIVRRDADELVIEDPPTEMWHQVVGLRLDSPVLLRSTDGKILAAAMVTRRRDAQWLAGVLRLELGLVAAIPRK